MLAVLALTPSHRRSRTALQSMFWSRNGPSDGAQNLRTALRRIRVALGDDADCVHADSTMVALQSGRFEVDIDTYDFAGAANLPESNQPLLLEDLDILKEPEFEDWLRDQRLAFETRLDEASRPAPQAATSRNNRLAFWLRVSPPDGLSGSSEYFYSNLVATAIAQGVSECGAAEIATTERDTPGINLKVSMLTKQNGAIASASLSEAHSDRILWTGNRFIPTGGEQVCDETALMRFVNQMVDIAVYCFRNLGSDRNMENAFTFGFDAIQKMFQLGRDELMEADALLDTALEQDMNGLTLAWKAYLRTFLVGEHNYDPGLVSEEVRALSRRAIELAPLNAYVLALSSYVHSFILQEFHAGQELAERSTELAPGNPLGHAFLGAAASYNGRHEQGLVHLTRARELSGPGPYAFTIDFLAGVASTLAGRHEEAVYLNEIVRQTKPDYKPAQRFLTALYLNLGDKQKAIAAMEELRKSEPDFSIRKMREPSYPSAALKSAGLLAQNDPDFS
ncbi:hypothetical protein NUH88_03780 [Nisaea acidiphila]|uniref:Tetratricopeptide repeat protein n=1 Tax=Nisaea acidiphila TaxID=1862145 RepID=A0A9J7AVJ9_9PROT|nr:hypothetical protein [Nisaea acidiphila]UUX50826.1 hypothetical protein NUH88_03780 [Nisaea acidiphila]